MTNHEHKLFSLTVFCSYSASDLLFCISTLSFMQVRYEHLQVISDFGDFLLFCFPTHSLFRCSHRFHTYTHGTQSRGEREIVLSVIESRSG